jgi:hypothetical protein
VCSGGALNNTPLTHTHTHTRARARAHTHPAPPPQKFDCNYGVPLIDFDFLFGSWVDFECFKEAGGDLAKGRQLTYERFGWGGKKNK